MKILPDYELHLKINKESLLARIYGVFTITMHKIAKVNLILMANTLNYKGKESVERIFDLKGSTVAREVKINQFTKNTATLKDINFVKINGSVGLMRLWPKDIAHIKSIVRADVEFCYSKGLMDYSFLLAIERFQTGSVSRFVLDAQDVQEGKELVQAYSLNEIQEEPTSTKSSRNTDFFACSTPNAKKSISDHASLNEYLARKGYIDTEFNRHQFLSSDGQFIYHISIIDYLQVWNMNKKMESFAKKWFLGKDGQKISAVPPGKYAQRFKRFMFRQVLVAE